jgi:hypothetical protein
LRARLVTAIAGGRLWLSQIETGAVNGVTEIVIREECSPRHVNMTISLTFLAPSLVKAAVEGRLPRGIGLARLIDAPIEWDQQHRMLGLASQAIVGDTVIGRYVADDVRQGAYERDGRGLIGATLTCGNYRFITFAGATDFCAEAPKSPLVSQMLRELCHALSARRTMRRDWGNGGRGFRRYKWLQG